MALVRRTRGHKRLALPAVVNLRAAVGGANPKRFPETVGQNWEELGELGELGELARWSGQSQNMPEEAEIRRVYIPAGQCLSIGQFRARVRRSGGILIEPIMLRLPEGNNAE
jgi:hypothetical protein